ncbi:putative disease resistance protein At1g50180 [Coffea eugenioides]|uniref:putative disease resistance protein At1g50180 n=1 Tax=Coffea eugenioides TaxID=49369 RepID=UPI000F6103EB|nr:putative disease resistance protein At1g50180 [Coffea eugenioides]
MVEAIVGSVLQILGRLLIEEAKFLSGVTDQVKGISRELKHVQCFLRDADAREYKDEVVRNWLREVRSLAYRIEDTVEMFAIEIAGNRGKVILTTFGSIFAEGRSRHFLGLEIGKLKTDINNLITSFRGYDVRAMSEAESSGATTNDNLKWARQTYAHEVEEYFVGKEEDIRKLVSLMVDDSKHHAIISVWGMGGLGKTTMKENIKNIEDRELVRQLYRVQTEYKCLIVLDDIWYVHDWENLVHAFPVVEGGSKMMLTTRTKEVAEIGYPYELQCLNEEESWELLKATISSRKYVKDLKIEKNLEAVGIEMVRKCGGLPLALHVLGGILKDKDSLREWKIVNANIGSCLSTRKGNEEGLAGGPIARVWSLSYNTLPYYLKPCFLYLGTFLEDEYIDAKELYLLWIAEGMVLGPYVHINCSFSISRTNARHNPLLMNLTCRLHDVMRDFCLKKGREEEFSEVIDLRGVEKPLLDSFSHTNNDAYRLVVHINTNVEAPINANAIVEDFKTTSLSSFSQ